jgi:integrase
MHKIQKFCTVERLRAYGFRGAFINFLHEKLGDHALPSIALAVGHADLKTTIKHYRKVRGAKGEEFVALVGEAFDSVEV